MNTDQNQLPKTVLLYALSFLAVIISLSVLVGFIVLIPNEGDMNSKTINVQGTGEVFASPDISEFNFTVREEDKDGTRAQTKGSEKVSKVLAELQKIGIAEEDIKTDMLSANPRYEWHETKPVAPCTADGSCVNPESKRVIVAYEFSQTITITLRDLTKSGEVLRALSVADVSDIYGPNMRIEDADALRTEARREAIDKAREQAKIIASDLGVRLGKMTYFYEDNNGGYPMPYARGGEEMMYTDAKMGGVAMAPALAPEIPVGQNKITSTVNITYKIK